MMDDEQSDDEIDETLRGGYNVGEEAVIDMEGFMDSSQVIDLN